MPTTQMAQCIMTRGTAISHASVSEGLQSTTVLTWGRAVRAV